MSFGVDKMKLIKTLLFLSSLTFIYSLQATWTFPVNISAKEGNAPQLAVDASGNALVVWIEGRGGGENIQSSTKPFGGQWEAPVNLSGASAFNPHIVVDAVGNATAVWIQPTGNRSIVLSSTKPSGKSWSFPPLPISGISASHPELMIDSAGNVTAVWMELLEGQRIIRSSTKMFENRWIPLNITTSGQSCDPQVAVDAAGILTAIWTQDVNGFDVIHSATKPYIGIWSPATPISALDHTAYHPKIAVDSAGNAIAIWAETIGTSVVIQSSTKTAKSGWEAPINLSDASSPGVIAVHPQIIVDSAGNATAIWMMSEGSDDFSIQSSTKLLGESWSPCTTLSKGQMASDPQLAVDSAGDVIAVWTEMITNHGNNVVQCAVKLSGKEWSSPPITLSALELSSTAPQIVIDPAGNATVVWMESNGNDVAIRAAEHWIIPPTIQHLTPSSASTNGEDVVFIMGTNFLHATSVEFGDIPATHFTVNSNQSITAIVPPGVSGTVSVSVTTLFGTSPSNSDSKFTYISPPVVSHLSPDCGPTSGGNTVTIIGSEFTKAVAVKFGETLATHFNINSDTSITAIAPPGIAGPVNVVVALMEGDSCLNLGSQYTYLAPAVQPILLPPTKLRGSQKINAYATHTEVVNTMSWNPPAEGIPPVAYEIYRDQQLTNCVATISSSSKLRFEDRRSKKHQSYTYFIVSVDQEGKRSTPVRLVLSSKKPAK
jgi:hypothetical protein